MPCKHLRKNPQTSFVKDLTVLLSSRQIHHCNIVAKSGNVFVIQPIRPWSTDMLPGAFHPTNLKEPEQESADEIWIHLSRWKFSSWLQEPVLLQYLWRSVHTGTTLLFLFWGLQVCLAYSGSEAILCVTFSSVLCNSKFHLAVEHLSVLAHLLLILRLQKFFAYLSKHQVWVQFFFVLG